MIKEIIATGKDIIEAKENARAALGAGPLDDVNFEIIHAGSKGIFGIIGVKPAQVRAYIEIPDREERRKDRHKKDRPQKDRPKTSAQTAENDESSDSEAASVQDKPKKHKNKKKKSHEAKDVQSTEQSKPRSVVIPECELNFTLREVGEGEDMSYDFIKTLILDIGLSATADLYSCDDGTRRITIKGEDASILIGHHGDTLDALQYLANLASARKNASGERDKSRVTIDIEGYRAKREETLRALARKMAAKALRNRRSVMLEPMSAYERRIIHSEIQKMEGVSTNSIGSDNNRKIVIYLTDKKPSELFEEKDEDVNESTNECVTETLADADATPAEEATENAAETESTSETEEV